MKKKSNNRYLLIAAVVCVLAVGVGTFTALQDGSSGSAQTTAPGVTAAFTLKSGESTTAPAAQANEPVSGIFGLRADTDPGEPEPTVQESESSKNETEYRLPMGTGILKNYSAGELLYSATMKDWRTHNGIDFSAEAGTVIYAAADGTVRAVFADEFWGTVIEIDCADAVTMRYCGAENGVSLREGDTVRAGDALATLGTVPVESADAPHLHFEILKDGEYLDPLDFLGFGESGNSADQ